MRFILFSFAFLDWFEEIEAQYRLPLNKETDLDYLRKRRANNLGKIRGAILLAILFLVFTGPLLWIVAAFLSQTTTQFIIAKSLFSLFILISAIGFSYGNILHCLEENSIIKKRTEELTTA